MRTSLRKRGKLPVRRPVRRPAGRPPRTSGGRLAGLGNSALATARGLAGFLTGRAARWARGPRRPRPARRTRRR